MNRLLLAPLLLAALAAGCREGEANRSADAVSAAEARPLVSPVATGSLPVPALTGRVMDSANILSPATESEVGARLAALEARTSDQLVVVTVPDLGGETIEAVSMRLANGWGVGRADLDNGVLLIIAPTERKTRIAVGTGLEGLLTNARSAEIIQKLVDRFKQGGYDEGVSVGVGEIIRTLESDTSRPKPLIAPKADRA